MAEAEILSVLAKEGLVAGLRSPVVLVGRSGMRHTFSFGIGDGDRPEMVCDISVRSKEQDETQVLSLFIKVIDVGLTRAMLCVSPALTEGASRLAKLYNIVTLESQEPGKIPQMIEKALKTPGKAGKGRPAGKPKGRRRARHP